MENMKVIIRREYDAYRKEWGYLAAFPESSSNPGTIFCLPFYIDENGKAIFEPHTEVHLSYYYKTKLVHANTDEAEKCKIVIEDYYNSMSEESIALQVVEKIIR